jgi:hypothetical protein
MSDLSPESAPKRTLITLLSPIAIYGTVEISRQTQMEPAKEGPDAGEE